MKQPPDGWSTLKSHQRDILISLNNDGPESGNALNRRLGQVVAHTTTHNHLDTLENAGLVSVAPKDDRENIYQITGNGEELLSKARRWMNDE